MADTVFSEARDRAIRMTVEHRGVFPSPYKAAQPIASQIGCVSHMLY
jgi:hypothetical protein